MKKLLCLVLILFPVICFADEKTELQKEIAIFQLQLQNLSMQAQYVIPAQFKEVEAKLKEKQAEMEKLTNKNEKPKPSKGK
jgi:hypothetical protein